MAYPDTFAGYCNAVSIHDKTNYGHVMGRVDRLISTSAGTLEQVLQSRSEVAECAAIPARDRLGGAIPDGFRRSKLVVCPGRTIG